MFEFDKGKVSLFTSDGKKLADGVTKANGLTLNCDLSNSTGWKLPEDFSLEYEIGLIENKRSPEEMNLIEELLFQGQEKQLKEFYDKVWKMTEKIMRNYVTPPIKGEITKGKVKWRGLYMVWQETDTFDAFVGIRQRDVLILPDGKKIHWDSLVVISREKIKK